MHQTSLSPENEPIVKVDKWYKDKTVIATGIIFAVVLFLIIALTLFMYSRNNSEDEATQDETEVSNNVPGFAEGIETKAYEFEITAPSSSTKLKFQTLIPLDAEISKQPASGENSEKHVVSKDNYKLTTFLTSYSENEQHDASGYIQLLPVEGAFSPIYQFYILKDGLYHYVNFLETENSCQGIGEEIPAPCAPEYLDLGYNTYISITCHAEDGFESICDDIVEGMKIEQLDGNNQIPQE